VKWVSFPVSSSQACILLEILLKTLVDELELEEVPKKEEGNIYQLSLNPQLSVTFQQLDPGLSLWARIGPCPIVNREELFILLMKANFLGQGTGGSSIGLDENENFLTLSSVLPYDMNFKMFKDALEDFTNYLDYWREELIRHKKAAEENIL
jgi:hypothetical protein